ncbi:MAG: hypothetical protein ACI4TT_03695 [Christensenellales bacterium]
MTKNKQKNNKPSIDNQIDKLNQLLNLFGEYVSVFRAMPPQGEQAKFYAIQEFNVVTNKVINKINDIKTQIIMQVENGK